jgi:hypothetical protein
MSRQAKRANARTKAKLTEAAWNELKAKRRPGGDGHYLGRDALLPYFWDPVIADMVRDNVEMSLKSILGTKDIPEKGLRVVIRILHVANKDGSSSQCVVAGSQQGKPEQNSHVAIMGYFDDGNVRSPASAEKLQDMAYLFEDTTSEIRLPFYLLCAPEIPKRPFDNNWLYQIRFNAEEARRNGVIDQAFFNTIGHGYVGVTARPFVKRMIEHFKDMRDGNGHLLHSVWRDLRRREIPHRVIAQISGYSRTEDEIYELEEKLVEKLTLAPMGLNMIPGGRNGIAQLRAMGFANAGMENRDRLLAKAIKERGERKTHYRKAHSREYAPGKFTLVKGAWVNARKKNPNSGSEDQSASASAG